ncbi:MAG TPA: di-heme oxidoredictase family protein [Polyangiaceae bacterium]|nr:di-heme oxidoredictase family protein [Polyangiaceae bacterium]
MTRGWLALLALVAFGSDCSSQPKAVGASPAVQQSHSASLVASPDRTRLFVAHPDADSVSIIDRASRSILHDIVLSESPPTQDPVTQQYVTSVQPRALAASASGRWLYVTGERSGALYAIDATSGVVRSKVAVCAEPIGVLLSADDQDIFVACSQDDEVVELDSATLTVKASASCPAKPWALAWAADGETLLVTHFLGAGISVFGTQPLVLRTTWPVQPTPSSGDPTEPHGIARGLYDAVVRPGTNELWTTHLMLGTDTAQPQLVFNNTVFPAVSLFDEMGSQRSRLSVQTNARDGQAFGDVVSGPHAITFSDDGELAFIVDSNSEDVLIIDAAGRIEVQLVRPLPGHMPEGIVWLDGEIYVQERNTEDIAVFRITKAGAQVSAEADGAAFQSIGKDPMPSTLRLGQRVFYSANSGDLPVTRDHWVACASCHLEGRSDAVTWKFAQGPRDTPTNAGGLLDTGFLFRTADRTRVQDYFRTINVEQGGHFDGVTPSQQPLLDALADFVNYAIPAPMPPTWDATHTVSGAALDQLRSAGAAVFTRVGCTNCHSGPAKTDSGQGNALLDLTGSVVSTATPGGVLLHDVGTCVTTGAWPDVAHNDIDGDPRDGCAFDTPALRGLADSAPYLHDGSAATLADVLPSMLQAVAAPGQPPTTLSSDDQHALLEYLRSL